MQHPWFRPPLLLWTLIQERLDPQTVRNVVALGPLHDKIRLSPRVLPRRKVPYHQGNEMTSRSNVRESA